MSKMVYTGNQIAGPEWRGDFGSRTHVMPFPAKVDPTQFTDGLGIPVVLTAPAVVGATTLAISALTPLMTYAAVLAMGGQAFIPQGATIAMGNGKFATLTAPAALGATSLSVLAIPTALIVGDTGVYSHYGRIFIPAGTLVSRTYAQRDAGTPFHPAVTTDDEIYLTYFDVISAYDNNDIEFYRHASLVKENYLPGYASMPGANLTAIRALYQCIKGVD